MLNIKVVAWSSALWAALSFVLCVVYGLFAAPAMHMEAFLLQALPWYDLHSLRGFVLGLLQSFLDGAYAGFAYVLIYNAVHRKCVRPAK